MGRTPAFQHPRYRILSPLGEGGMGKVYLARDLIEEREVALKVYPARRYDERLRAEFLALRDLHHPGIARALGFGVEERSGAPFLALERVAGEPCDRFLASQPDALRVETALGLLVATARAVAYLHRRGVLHLDLKPENILVVAGSGASPPRPVIIDFGLSRAARAGSALDHATLSYAPPEAFTAGTASPASDVYSLAATFYRLLSGRCPVIASGFEGHARAHRQSAAAPLPEAPPAVERVILRALAKDPARRFRDAGELAQALSRAPGIERLSSPRELPYHEPDFVGRQEQLAALRAWIDAGRRERPIFTVVAGSGWGKSRFLEKAQTELEARGSAAYLLRPEPGLRLGFVTAWRRLAGVVGGRRQKPPRTGEEPIEAPGSELSLQPLLDLVRGGAFLLLDDAHLADPAELMALSRAARTLAAGGTPAAGGIVLASQESPAASPPLDDAQVRVELGPFGLEEALGIDLEGLDGALSGLPSTRVRALKTRLHDEVGGQPLFFVRGLLSLAGEAGSADRLLPARALERQARGLAGLERDAALLLALLDRPAAPGELEAVLGLSAGGIAGALASLRSRGLAAQDATARLVHELVRRAVLAAAPPGDRRRLQLALAASMERSATPGAAVQAAWHHFEAGEVSRGLEAALAWEARSDREPGAPPSRAVEALGHAARAAGEGTAAGRRLLEAAGDVLEAMGQFEECAALRLRVAPGGDGSAAPAADDVRRLRKLGAVAHRAGDLDLALRSLLRCLDAAATEAAPVESLRARADLALLLHYRGESEAAREQAETGLGAWRSRSPAERRATLQAAVNLHSVLGQIHLRRLAVGPASQVLEAGLACARRLPSAANRTLLLNSLGLAYHLGGRLDRALATFREAERLGGEQGDPAALVSVRTNIAQILARRGRLAEAQALLDELTESAAVRQSVRLRLNVTYTRALFLHLLGAATAAEWREVARQSSEAGDAFLERFSHLYQAEACLVAGDLRQAGSLLGELDEPLLARQRLARQALHAALSGQGEEARRLRTATLEGEESPAMLHIWSLVHCGASALEQGALDESHGLLDKARRLARETDFVLARLECDLLLADLHLRRAGAGAGAKQEARFLRAAREAIEAARQPIPSPLAGLSPRARDARLPLLEARLLLLSPAAEQGRRSARAPRLDDLLAAAAGDAALAARPDERLLLECLTATAARQAGEAERARAALQRLAALEAAIAEQRAAGSPPVDPWQRFGLARHRPPAGSPELESRHVAALTRLLRIAAQGASFEAALAELGAALGAARIELLANGRTQVWGERASRRETTGDEGRLAAPLSWRGESLGTLVALGLKRPSAADDACLTAAALALAPRLWVEAQPSAHPGAAGHETQRLVLEERTPGRGTVPLEAARSRPRQRATTEALTRFFRDEGMVIAGPRLLAAARSALALAGADLPVLMTGESGTGKSLLGRILHRLGPRADGPYIAQSASAVPLELFEADLFGYERGAFTGAETARTGFLFQAAGGTFHLEEVGDLSPELQQRLLRVIEEREVRPLGSTRPRALDVRFIASTQRDLEALVAAGQFRKDLYYRLGAAPIHLPPLRECPEAIPEIVARHWRELTGESVRPSRGVVDALAAHPWPGNVRELVTVLRRLCIEGDRELSVRALRQILGDAPGRSLFAPDIFEGRTLAAVQKALEERHLEHLFRKHRGDLAAIALELGTSTRSVYRRFERLGLKPGRMRAERE